MWNFGLGSKFRFSIYRPLAICLSFGSCGSPTQPVSVGNWLSGRTDGGIYVLSVLGAFQTGRGKTFDARFSTKGAYLEPLGMYPASWGNYFNIDFRFILALIGPVAPKNWILNTFPFFEGWKLENFSFFRSDQDELCISPLGPAAALNWISVGNLLSGRMDGRTDGRGTDGRRTGGFTFGQF